MTGDAPWTQPLRLNELDHGKVTRRVVADEAARARIASALDLLGLHLLEADLTVSPWLDGAMVEGAWRARIEQICGVTLDPFETELAERFTVRLLPAEKLALEQIREVEIDPNADDPPDPIEGGRIDLGALVVEHLVLEIDPFPRRPGVVFEPPEGGEPPSPFAVLRDFKAKGEEG